MKVIEMVKIDATTYRVNVAGGSPTSHLVTIDPVYAMKLTSGEISTEQLLEKSFEFLLDREPNTSILRSFDLCVIRNYFPEYEREIKTVMQGK